MSIIKCLNLLPVKIYSSLYVLKCHFYIPAIPYYCNLNKLTQETVTKMTKWYAFSLVLSPLEPIGVWRGPNGRGREKDNGATDM